MSYSGSFSQFLDVPDSELVRFPNVPYSLGLYIVFISYVSSFVNGHQICVAPNAAALSRYFSFVLVCSITALLSARYSSPTLWTIS